MKPGCRRQDRGLAQRACRQCLALGDQDCQPRQHEHAHDVVVIGRAGQADRQPAGHAQRRQRRRRQTLLLEAQQRARDQIERHDIGALHGAQHAQREPGRHVLGQPVIGDVEQRIVIGRLMRHRDVEAHPSVQEGEGRIPMVIAEVPRHVLAEGDHEQGPAEDDQAEEQHFPWRQPGSALFARLRHGIPVMVADGGI